MSICMLQNYAFAVYSSFEFYVLQYVCTKRVVGIYHPDVQRKKKGRKKEKIFYFELLMLIECIVHIS